MRRPSATIRDATAADVERIRRIARAAFAKYVPRIGREPAPMVADIAAAVAKRQVVVLDINGAVEGYMIARPDGDAYFIDTIAVDPSRQGSGLGRLLLDHASAQARTHGLPVLRLYTNAAMTENITMYGHLGFVETQRTSERGFLRVHFRLDL